MKCCFLIGALCLALVSSCSNAKAQVAAVVEKDPGGERFVTQAGEAELIEKNLGAKHQVCLAMLGPANWRDTPEEILIKTALAFVESKTGRVILNIEDRGFRAFATHGKGLHPVKNPPVTPDRSKVALVLQWWRYADLAVYEVKGTEVREVKIELPNVKDVVAEQHPNITPTNSFRHVTISVRWHGNSELEIEEEGVMHVEEDAEQSDDHEVTLHCTVRFKDGQAEVVPSTVWSSFEGKGPAKKAPQPDKDGRKTSHRRRIVSAKASEADAVSAKAAPAPAAPTTPPARFSLWRPFGH